MCHIKFVPTYSSTYSQKQVDTYFYYLYSVQ